ncbi:MAG TPA: hypothetical protein VJ813_20835 [Vicinamibacterales bacterium]|nr:hypothetical protein [Vicinamibacterales bacterium]
MTSMTLSLKHAPFRDEQICGACGASFVPEEDSGSRMITVGPAGAEPVAALMCGGCHSKWSHGSTLTLRTLARATR